MHGGRVEARNDGIGKGSEFIVRLPVVISSTEAVPRIEDNVRDHSQIRRRILVVDDNQDSAESMVMMLKLSGHDVAMAHDGFEAV